MFTRTKYEFLKDKCGCPLCKKEKAFKTKGSNLYENKFSYDKVHFYSNKPSSKEVDIFCKVCNKFFKQTPREHLLGYDCTHCNRLKPREYSKGETKIKGVLSDLKNYLLLLCF